MTKNHKKCPQNGGFSPMCDPKHFFQKSGSVTSVPLGCPNSMQKIKKTNERSLRYLKTDGPRKDGQGRLLRTPLGEPGVLL